MKYKLHILLALFMVSVSMPLFGWINPKLHKERAEEQAKNGLIQSRGDEACEQGFAQIDMDVNNVRARLLSRGDFWWDYDKGQYIVPKVEPGQIEVSSIFSGAVWVGGRDPAGNLKMAAQDYGNGGTDYYPGPLRPDDGGTNSERCKQWDRHWTVSGSAISQHIANYQQAVLDGRQLTDSEIPEELKKWPARGNRYFVGIYDFPLPDTDVGLASFYDQNEDGKYTPTEGDYPVIDIRGCPLEFFPDQMIFQIYNDAGNTHTQSGGDVINMEVQVQAFAFATSDQLNDMTFMRYKLVNRASEDITNCYFAMWIDPDLGCHQDDFIGCDTSTVKILDDGTRVPRNLAFVYNSDDIDGIGSGDGCDGTPTYGTKIPIIGVDYFRGPLDEFGDEIGMSSFTYYNNGGIGSPEPNTSDPSTANQFYNYIQGLWRDGSSVYDDGDGYFGSNPPTGANVTKFAFPDLPNDPNGWSMAQEPSVNPEFDRRIIQASGPFTLHPQRKNELIIGLPWVPNQAHPAPDMSELFAADDLAQALFDNCFETQQTPDAPDIDIVELDQQLVLVLYNDQVLSNNRFESFVEKDLFNDDEFYRFQGYKIYQVADASVSASELDDAERARLIYNVDLQDGITEVYNYSSLVDPITSDIIYFPELQVKGTDDGIRHTFNVTSDAFAEGGDTRLRNQSKYYFMAVAYAYNNFEQFDPNSGLGQQRPYIDSEKNARKQAVKATLGIPRLITDVEVNSAYGVSGIEVTRLAGVGTGGNTLDLTNESRDLIAVNNVQNELTYKGGAAPLDVIVYNPLEVVDGTYQLRVQDSSRLEPDGSTKDVKYWVLDELDDNNNSIKTTLAYEDLDTLTERVIRDYGFSLLMGDTYDSGVSDINNYGAHDGSAEFLDPANQEIWLSPVQNATGAPGINSYLSDFLDIETRQEIALSTAGGGIFYPYKFIRCNGDAPGAPYTISPAWENALSCQAVTDAANPLTDQRNIDVVFTSDKSKWSRCVVVETAGKAYYDDDVALPGLVKPEGNANRMDLRKAPSVGKDDMDGDGLADPDGDGEGMGWFPGYAVDIETGERLNIFFGENSVFRKTDLSDAIYPDLVASDFAQLTGADMMFNPSDLLFYDTEAFTTTGDPIANSLVIGGQHMIYVTKEPYDGCAVIRTQLTSPIKLPAISKIRYTGIFYAVGEGLNSYADGLIPSDIVVKTRVDNSFQDTPGIDVNNGDPTYQFTLSGYQAQPISTSQQYDDALAAIQVTPNPYYGYSDYEIGENTNTVKITNLPAKCTVSIYSLDGKFIRKYDRDEIGQSPTSMNSGVRTYQVSSAVEWDMRNARNIPIASGVYLIHIDAPGYGERVVKWFGVNRQFDASQLPLPPR